ncbi:MAG: hypothetical protein JO152_00320 [Mycobacteriaceae bacterium]|nr:hypothetical protein [Mycobacteriaceae bacterium]
MTHLLILAGLSISPSSGLPGNNSLQTLLNDIAGTILVLGGIGFLSGVAFKAVGAHGGNIGFSDTGGRLMFWGAFAMILSGAAAVIINFFYGLGTAAH